MHMSKGTNTNSVVGSNTYSTRTNCL